MNLSPKEKFQKNANFKELASMLNSNNMEYALETAMLTFCDNLPEGLDEAASILYHQQLVGARRFLRTLRGLSNFAETPKPNRIGQLNP